MDQNIGMRPSVDRTWERFGRRISALAIAGVAALIVACGSGGAGSGGDNPPASVAQPATVAPVAGAPDPTSTIAPTSAPEDEPTESPITSVPPITDTATSAPEPTPTTLPEFLIEDEAERSRAERLRMIWGWNTNFNERTAPLTELETVLPRDRITPIDEPTFVSVADAPRYMEPREPVVAVTIDGDSRAYPLAILMWHEIVNDNVGGAPVTVTFCPLCNTGITFSRIVDGQELTFGTSGMLRNSDLVMWDRQSESLWQQITGEALAGDFAADATVLAQLPSSIIAWETFAESYPNGLLLERVVNDSGSPERPYDNPPYAGYDNVDDQPFLFRGKIDDRLVATSRVLTIDGETPIAYPFAFLKENPVLNDSINDLDIVAFFDDETFSAFNSLTNEHQTSGSVTVFSRTVDGRSLTFETANGGIIDIETGSAWNLLGLAIDGELAGTKLEPIVHANHFWFAWAVFKPSTQIRDSMSDLTP
jgi:hypothetical protein